MCCKTLFSPGHPKDLFYICCGCGTIVHEPKWLIEDTGKEVKIPWIVEKEPSMVYEEADPYIPACPVCGISGNVADLVMNVGLTDRTGPKRFVNRKTGKPFSIDVDKVSPRLEIRLKDEPGRFTDYKAFNLFTRVRKLLGYEFSSETLTKKQKKAERRKWMKDWHTLDELRDAILNECKDSHDKTYESSKLEELRAITSAIFEPKVTYQRGTMFKKGKPILGKKYPLIKWSWDISISRMVLEKDLKARLSRTITFARLSQMTPSGSYRDRKSEWIGKRIHKISKRLAKSEIRDIPIRLSVIKAMRNNGLMRVRSGWYGLYGIERKDERGNEYLATNGFDSIGEYSLDRGRLLSPREDTENMKASFIYQYNPESTQWEAIGYNGELFAVPEAKANVYYEHEAERRLEAAYDKGLVSDEALDTLVPRLKYSIEIKEMGTAVANKDLAKLYNYYQARRCA